MGAVRGRFSIFSTAGMLNVWRYLMRKRLSFRGERVVGTFAVLLILLLAKLVTPAYDRQQTREERIRGFLARRAIDAIAIIGWTVDRVSGVPMERPREEALRAAR